jgi:hypothetical protein
VSSENKNNKDRKEITSTNAVTPTTGNTKEEEELTPVIKPETTGINGEIMVITPPLIKYSKVVVVRPSSQEKKEGEYDPISDKAKETSKSLINSQIGKVSVDKTQLLFLLMKSGSQFQKIPLVKI